MNFFVLTDLNRFYQQMEKFSFNCKIHICKQEELRVRMNEKKMLSKFPNLIISIERRSQKQN
jgi:hypothetical protein